MREDDRQGWPGGWSIGRLAGRPEGLPAWLAAVPIGFARADPEGVLRACNPAFARLAAAAAGPAALVGQRLADLVARGDRDDVSRQLSKLVMGMAGSVRLEETRFAAAGDSARPVTLVAQAVAERGQVSQLLLWALASAGRGGSPAALAQAQKMQAVGQLAGGIAHDFNNLLTGMLGFCDLLLTRHPPGDASHMEIAEIRASALRAGSLVRQLLAFSRKQALAPVRLTVGAALADLSSLLRRLLGPAVELRVDDASGGATIEVDPGQFDQVIINLAVNARDAMPGGGLLAIQAMLVSSDGLRSCGDEAMPAGRYVRIDVSDSGCGIPKGILGHIFEPFFTTKEAGAGTGLGLATVFGIVRQTGGYIFVDSALGEGSTFSLYLPPAEGDGTGDTVRQPATPLPAEASGGSAVAPVAVPDSGSAVRGRGEDAARGEQRADGGVVLLVDDEDPVRAVAARALRRAGYRVLEAGSADQALAVLGAQPGPVNVLLTDVMMPGMDGNTLARLVRREHPAVRVVTMSGYQEDGPLPGSPPLAGTFLQKPFTLAELVHTVEAALAAPP